MRFTSYWITIGVIRITDSKSIIRQFFRNVSNDALDAFDTIERSMDELVQVFVKRYLTENIIYQWGNKRF